MSDAQTRTIKVDYIARVEGEAALHVALDGDEVRSVEFRIFEPPRFFEALLRGRHFTEAVDITSRICGICPVAYMMSAAHAMEDACGVRVEGPLRELRRLLYCGEWIESHVLHVAMLHLPDFLDYPDAMTMAKDHPEPVQTALRVKALGNRILRLLGGREIHPINVRVGGFYKLPPAAQLRDLRGDLDGAIAAVQDLLKLVAGLRFPELHSDYELAALRHPSEYPFNEGRCGSSLGADIDIAGYERRYGEEHVAHSNALHSRRLDAADSAPILMGPPARFALNQNQLTPLALAAVKEYGLQDAWRNPFRSICLRTVEVLFALEEAARIIDGYRAPEHPCVDVQPRAGVGYGCTEAPRGSCYHRYRIDGQGLIQEARIVPPTAVNQRAIEADLRRYLVDHVRLPQDELRQGCERVIRNFDPCISCATHFLKLSIHRESGHR